ncbi:[LSU ribosomal protein L11P]-lysine N-methyltransferase [Kushneria sinocarnis]|uniref:Ribosomal protein L11 methyltransferase n=1 Tax=Kushneria sinocarnis TaxID=595502 RepID=A0A420WYW1_9GAMM|nr:50S ribosomal protein L11 methyltransferase [Kushneria sinocarnis]RKR06422.1 [LSU ribosomal protein L11P]-lysine N-methyltransferase [Kushneria sinocarnis]
MAWLQLKAHVSPDNAELLEELLTAEGASAITLEDAVDDPVFEPERGTTPLWQQTVLTGLYDDLEDVQAMIERVARGWAEQAAEEPCPEIEYDVLEDRDWSREWMEGFEPLQMGRRLWIVPSWQEAPDPEGVNLLLDPGLAFGTGTHPTTALCLRWLDELADQGALTGAEIMDIGCGSGILAIAALRLGARHAIGTDIDPQALQASRDNARRNEIEDDDFDLYLPEQAPDSAHGVVIANILAMPLIELADTIAGSVAPGGRIALSGILVHQAESVLEAYRERGLIMHEPTEQEGWIRLDGYRPA